MRVREFISESTTTLKSLYGDNYPDRDELFWDWVRPGELELPLTVQTLSKHRLLVQLLSQYRAEHIDEIVDLLNDDQRNIIERYRSDPNLSNKIIVIAANRIVDGNHRALAAALNGTSIKYVDLAELDKENLSERKRKRKSKSTRPVVFGGWWGWPGDNSSAEGDGGDE